MEAIYNSSTEQGLDWQAERQRWTIYYKQHLRRQLIWAIEYVRKCRNQPSKLMKNIDSLLTLLHQASTQSDLHQLKVDLIDVLHPWPSRWGRWEVWEQELRFAAQISTSLGQLDRSAECLENLASIFLYTGRLKEAQVVSEEAVSLARKSNAVLPLVRSGVIGISTLLTLGQTERANFLLDELENDPIFQQQTSKSLKTIIKAYLDIERTNLLRYQGYIQEAVSLVNKVVTSLEALSTVDSRLLAYAYKDRGVVLWAQGTYSVAIQDFNRAIVLSAQEGDLFTEAFACGDLGLVYWSMAEFDLAEKSIRRSINIVERLNAPWRLIAEVGNLGLIYLSRGQLQQSLLYIERQINLATRLNDAYEQRRGRANRGTVRLLMGEYDAARRDFEMDLAFAKEYRKEMLGAVYANLSWCYDGLGQPEYARSLAEQALQLGYQINSIALQSVGLRCLAELQPFPKRVELLHQALALVQLGLSLSAVCYVDIKGQYLAKNLNRR